MPNRRVVATRCFDDFMETCFVRCIRCGGRNPLFPLKVPPNYRDPSFCIVVLSSCDCSPVSLSLLPRFWMRLLGSVQKARFWFLSTVRPAQNTDTAWRGPETETLLPEPPSLQASASQPCTKGVDLAETSVFEASKAFANDRMSQWHSSVMTCCER